MKKLTLCLLLAAHFAAGAQTPQDLEPCLLAQTCSQTQEDVHQLIDQFGLSDFMGLSPSSINDLQDAQRLSMEQLVPQLIKENFSPLTQMKEQAAKPVDLSQLPSLNKEDFPILITPLADADPSVIVEWNPSMVALEGVSCQTPSESVSFLNLLVRSGACVDAKDYSKAAVFYYQAMIRMKALGYIESQLHELGLVKQTVLIDFYESIEEKLGAPLLNHLGGHIPEWITLMNQAQAADLNDTTPVDLPFFLNSYKISTQDYEKVKAFIISNFDEFKTKIDQNKKQIYHKRKQNKLPVRDPAAKDVLHT